MFAENVKNVKFSANFRIFHSGYVKNSAFIIVLKYSYTLKKYKYNLLKMQKTC